MGFWGKKNHKNVKKKSHIFSVFGEKESQKIDPNLGFWGEKSQKCSKYTLILGFFEEKKNLKNSPKLGIFGGKKNPRNSPRFGIFGGKNSQK